MLCFILSSFELYSRWVPLLSDLYELCLNLAAEIISNYWMKLTQ